MAKKNKKITKINQKVREFFDGDPFDVGIERLSSQKLSELVHTLGIYDVEHNKKALLKLIRALWSEADIELRQDIYNFLRQDGSFYRSTGHSEQNLDRSAKIEAILQELDVSAHEAALLFDAFSEVRSKKITIEKMESKLAHIRFEEKKREIQKALDGVFNFDDALEFNASINYKLYGDSFHKILVLTTKPYEYSYLLETPKEEIIEKIKSDQYLLIGKKQEEVATFVASLKDPHPYLSHKEISDAFRSAPPKIILKYPPLKEQTLRTIISKKVSIIALELHDQELLLKVDASFTLPYSQHAIAYTLDVHLELEHLLESIYLANELDFDDAIANAKKEHEEAFLADLALLVSQCSDYASLLHLSQEQLHKEVYNFLLDYLTATLNLTAKISRKTLRGFMLATQDAIIKKQRQELLARTIRDFKNLFPVARNLRRKLILHIGPTNSGKTYQAMQKLEAADTGYYLAPLRLLALEGYEGLREKGIAASLITGEEQLLDEEATHISSTIEMLNFDVDVDVCVIDEVQMIDDRDRGWAWANAIIGAPAKEIIMTGSSNAKEAIIALAEYLGEELEIIEFERKNPLTLLESYTHVKDVEAGTAIIAFSRKDVLKLKQNFARFFTVSVVYGNLSPEVRREEARRFREQETQILVATDAIAMGMNLPIKTILFSKADKFDGVSQRDLFPSEVHQISGRAGRFGLKEEGFVGALSPEVLHTITKVYNKADRQISVPFKVMANLEHIKLVSSILEENSLQEILKFFVQNMEFSGPFRATNLEDMMLAAEIVDNYDLDIAMKYHLACAPLTMKSPYIISAFEGYIMALEKKIPVPYITPKLIGSYAATTDELLRAEDMVKEISLYLWLSYRFKEYFLDVERARQSRGILNRFIEESLQQSHFVPRCKMCGAPLPMNTKYTICQSCFKKHYTGKNSKGFRR